MKRSELERRLKNAGWWFLRHGGSHDVWTNGEREMVIPRHNEIGEGLSRTILKRTGAAGAAGAGKDKGKGKGKSTGKGKGKRESAATKKK